MTTFLNFLYSKAMAITVIVSSIINLILLVILFYYMLPQLESGRLLVSKCIANYQVGNPEIKDLEDSIKK